MEEADWQRLIDGLKSGDCTPFLGAGISASTLPTGTALSRTWARKLKYPFPNKDVLTEVMEYAVITHRDPVYIKRQVAKMLAAKGRPDLTSPTEPHALLAKLPLPVYFTTNYDDFMMQALIEAGRSPTALTCDWYGSPRPHLGPPSRLGFTPSPDKPVVFHLHGTMNEPETMVLSRTDYLEFLISLSIDHGNRDQAFIPTELLPSLTSRPLLFIGYSLQDWTFNVLFQGLLKTVSSVQHRRHISVQLLPQNIPSAATQDAQRYHTRALEQWNILPYWCRIEDFCDELRHRMGWDR